MEASLQLKDGRTLAYAEYGEPRGTPVFFFRGMPGSRLFHPPDEITQKLGTHLVTADRPGYGLSTYQPGRRIVDWPEDITQLADHLGIDRFAVAGHSGGGPYAAACACILPDRVNAAAILSGVGPITTPGAVRGMSLLSAAGFKLGRFFPWLLWQQLIRLVYHERGENPSAVQEREAGRRPSADEQLMSIPGVREVCAQSEVEAFRFGLSGLAWDARLLTLPWGFPLEKIRVPVSLWHGTADRETPIAMGRFVAGKIPTCRATFCPGEAHLLLFPHWEEILRALIPS